MDKKNKTGAEILGVHLEGPFLSRKYAGAQLPDYLMKPSVENFKHFETTSGNTIKLVTLAIEEEGALQLLNYLKERNIVVSAGHTAAGYKEMKKAVENGLTCVTHTYNGMRPLRRDDIGTVGSAFLFDELYCEAICDGIHISEPAIKVLCKNKPVDKIILVTDALRTKYMPDGIYYELEQVLVLKDDVARLEDGRLAGSVLKLNKAIRDIMKFAKIDFETAVKFATENPAKNLGVFDIMGSIKENKLANFAIVDKELNVYQTIRNGIEIYNVNEVTDEL
jgi:N-acetylglucosamine-6-phosphate deacetylase